MNEKFGWYFTAPWDPVLVRRGDALGLRGAADHYADLLAPGLSNATADARWISILAWCLRWSHLAWKYAGGAEVSRREEQRARYAWLRPLELLWVDRTLESGQETGQLRGRRSIERWRKADRRLPDFAMSPDQFRRYRQVGMYGAYRVILRKVAGLTTGDGWTPAGTAVALAELVNESLPRAVRLAEERLESRTKWGGWSGGQEARYWVERGWESWRAQVGGMLPTPDEAVVDPLPAAERRLLEPTLFPEGSVRRITAETLARAKGARTHAELCDVLASSSTLAKKVAPGSIVSMPAFSRIADAGMHAMRWLWYEVNQDQRAQAPTLENLARSPELRSSLALLRDASTAWLRAPGRSVMRHEQVVTRLAETMRAATTPLAQVGALARHHQEHGGGRRWFREDNGRLLPLVADSGIAASDYGFRLRPLIRLAAQCGVANMSAAVAAITRSEPAGPAADEEEGDTI